MISNKNYASSKLAEILAQKKQLNPRYSLRAFSNYLGMPASTLALVLNGKRKLPQKNIESVIEKLSLSKVEAASFRESLSKRITRLDKIQISDDYFDKHIVNDSYFQVISEWEHYAIITLMETTSFESSVKFISSKLNILPARVEEVIDNLEVAGLVRLNDRQELELAKGPIKTSEDITSKALNLSHKETLDMAKSKLDEISVEFRDFSSITIATNLSKMGEAKSIIREFRQKMGSLLEGGDQKEVFQLSIQLYPLTRLAQQEC